MTNGTNEGTSGAITALLAILVIAVIGFGLWFVMGSSAAAPENPGELKVNVEGVLPSPAPAPGPAPSPQQY